MTLNQAQRDTTAAELTAAMKKLRLTLSDVATDLSISVTQLTDILQLRAQAQCPENVWIVRNYLLERDSSLLFSVLKSDYHNMWFLDSRKIDAREIS